MAVLNPLAHELALKIVYCGPGLGGKTTSLEFIHRHTSPEHRGEMVSLATPVDRTLHFDYLPVRVPQVRNMTVRLQLFTVPGQVYYNATRKMVLTGADGVVFVADSQRQRSDANVESLVSLEDDLSEHGRILDEMPHVFQYNKRDLEDVDGIEELERRLNKRGAPSFATVATTGDGVYEALEAILRAALEDFEHRVPNAREVKGHLALPEGGLAEALRGAAEDVEAAVPPSKLYPESIPIPADSRGASFASLWSTTLFERAVAVEASLVRGAASQAILDCAELVKATLQGCEKLCSEFASSEPQLAAWLGIDAARWFWFWSLVADARSERPGLEPMDALEAYGMAVALRAAQRRILPGTR